MQSPARRAGTPQRALDAARQDRGDLMLAAVQRLARADHSAPGPRVWIAAASAFMHGAYATAVDLFDRWGREPSSRRSASWMHFMSYTYRARAHLSLGSYRESQRCLLEAEARLAETSDAEMRRSTLDLLRGHHCEWQDDMVGAKAHLRRAYEGAKTSGTRTGAAVAALELARLVVSMGEADAASRWVARAEAALVRGADTRLGLLARIRRGSVLIAFGETDAALRILSDAIDAPAGHPAPPEWHVEALLGRADAFVDRGNFVRAEADVSRAAELAERQGLRPLLAAASRARALVQHLHSPDGGDLTAAVHFSSALAAAISLDGPHGGLLRQCAQDILIAPELLGQRPAPVEARADLADIVSRLAGTARVPACFRSMRLMLLDRLRAELHTELARFVEAPVVLASCTVHPLTRRVVLRSGIRRIGRAQLAVLRELSGVGDRGLTISDLADRLSLEDTAIAKRLERLGRILGNDLEVIGGGRQTRRYVVRRAPMEDTEIRFIASASRREGRHAG